MLASCELRRRVILFTVQGSVKVLTLVLHQLPVAGL